MLSFCSSLQLLTVPQWRRRKGNICVFHHSTRRINFITCTLSSSSSSASMNDDSISPPKQNQIDYDPSEEFLGLEVDLQPRNVISGAPQPRSWLGPNGQYIKELPCPSCVGRGYTPCTECGLEESKLDCSQCKGKGLTLCSQCLGDCVIWEESIDERPWEKARSISPLKVKEDDEVDNLDIKLDVRENSKLIYQSPPPEVDLKISRSQRSLNAKTGLFTKQMKILHRDPKLHAQRVAALKKAKRTAAARKKTSEGLKAFYGDPENRRRLSIAMKGVKFYCSNCGREGHRRHYCPELIKDGSLDTQTRCRLCREKGHNRRTCLKPRSSRTRNYCRACGQRGHTIRTCPSGRVGLELVGDSKKGLLSSEGRNYTDVGLEPVGDSKKGLLSSEGWNYTEVGLELIGDSKKDLLSSEIKYYTCSLCQGKGHNIRTCPRRNKDLLSTLSKAPQRLRPRTKRRQFLKSSLTLLSDLSPQNAGLFWLIILSLFFLFSNLQAL